MSENIYFPGDTGIGFCSSRAESITENVKYFQTNCPESKFEVQHKTLSNSGPNSILPWFSSIMPEMLHSPFLKTWCMDYKLPFLTKNHVPIDSKSEFNRDELTLAAITDSENPQIKNVKSIKLFCRANEYQKLANSLLGLGLKQSTKEKFSSEDIELIIEVSEKFSNRIKNVDFSMTKPLSNQSIELFPGSYLNCNDGILSWTLPQ